MSNASISLLPLDTILEKLPRRQTDGAYIIQSKKRNYKVNTIPKGDPVIVRRAKGGLEKQYRHCCPRFYDDPLISRDCFHSFCAECIFKSLETESHCPLCRSWLRRDDLILNIALKNVAQELMVYCPYRKAGCTMVLSRDGLKSHSTQCPYLPSTCPNSGMGCGFKGSGVAVQKHIDECIFVKLKGYIEMNDQQISELRSTIEEQRLEILALKKALYHASQGKLLDIHMEPPVDMEDSGSEAE
ncbi:hypothetical protein HDV05_001483, partial [Chytridiales sp. JEL 0842]